MRDELDAQLGGQDVPGGNQHLLARVRHLGRATGQQREDALHHLSAVRADHLLVDAYDIGEERERLDLKARKRSNLTQALKKRKFKVSTEVIKESQMAPSTESNHRLAGQIARSMSDCPSASAALIMETREQYSG